MPNNQNGEKKYNVQKFIRGNLYFEDLSIGAMLIGCPPETLKDIMVEHRDVKVTVPQVIVLRDKLFDSVNKCICEELEQFIFYNFFNLNRITKIVCTKDQKERVSKVLNISMFGIPVTKKDIIDYYPKDFDKKAIPDLKEEFKVFAKDITMDDLVEFHVIDGKTKSVTVKADHPETGKAGTLIITDEGNNRFIIRDKTKKVVFKNIYAPIKAPKIPFTSIVHPNYVQIRNAISFVSTSSGFDPLDLSDTTSHAYGSTVSFVIWDDLGTGTVVDPPMGFPNWMRKMGIQFYKIQDLILTHTHFDHDVGAIERILEEPVNVHTTDTIMQAFLEKSSALTGISEEQILNSINFYPIKLHSPVKIGGFTYYFSHCIHSIETIRFTFQDHEGNAYYYSSDILYSKDHLQEWVDKGFITDERMDDLMAIPENASIYIHEQGGPSIHTPPEAIAAMSDHIRNNMWIVHTDTLPVLKNGDAIPGTRLAKPGTIIPLSTPREPQLDEFAATYQILSKLDRIPLFHNMPLQSIKDIRDLLRLVKPKRYNPGSQLIHYGDRPDKLYILIDGGVDIVLNEDDADDGNTKNQKMIHRNDFGFLIGDAVASRETEDKRDADVYAGMEGLTVLEIDEDSVNELEEKNIVIATLIRKNREMRKYGVYQALEKIPVVKDLPYSQMQEFALHCSVHILRNEDDRWLIKQGEWNDYLYIIAEGQADIIVQESDGTKVAKKRIATSESNIFGEISILSQSKTIASVYLTSELENTKVYKMHKNDFNNFLRNNPNFNLNFRKTMEDRIAETSQVRDNLIDVLRSISKEYFLGKK